MNRIRIVVVIALCLLVAPAAGANTTVTIDLLGQLYGVTALHYETSVDEMPSGMTLSVQTMFGEPRLPESKAWIRGFAAGVRYYTAGTVHDGYYFGGLASTSSLHGSYEGENVKAGVFGIHGMGGYKWKTATGLVLDAGLGFGFPVSAKGDLTENEYRNVLNANIGLALGFQF